MTNSNQNGNSSDRLDRIESVLERITDRLEQVSEAGQQTDARLDRVSERMEHIAAAVQDERIQRAEDYNELRDVIAITNQAVETTNHRIDAFITENRANWERYERHKAENDLRFNNLLADARTDREENRREHEAFRAAIQSLLNRQSEEGPDD